MAARGVVALLLLGAGVYLFAAGFLLRRTVLPDIQVFDVNNTIPARYDRLVWIVIDALRYDFTILNKSTSKPYLNKLPILSQTIEKHPNHGLLLPFEADAPTTTLQRLKGLTTGSLPTFIDVGSSFSSSAITEDNLISQFKSSGRRLAFLGDDTWVSCFPNAFDILHPFPSFNVWDLDSVDDGILEHLYPLLKQPKDWDVLIAHFLGVDHCGHRFGPDHPTMATKLEQMNTMIDQVIQALPSKTLLVVAGDHGMTSSGDHGGDSTLETAAALFLYTTGHVSEIKIVKISNLVFGTSPPLTGLLLNRKDVDAETSVRQIDIVPTLAVLLGVPIPFGSLGSILPLAFENWIDFAKALHSNVQQIATMLQRLGSVGFQTDTPEWNRTWEAHNRFIKEFSRANRSGIIAADVPTLATDAFQFMRTALSSCRESWAHFNTNLMSAGALACACAVFFALIQLNIQTLLPLKLGIIGALGSLTLAIALRQFGFVTFSFPYDIIFAAVIGFAVVFMFYSIPLLFNSAKLSLCLEDSIRLRTLRVVAVLLILIQIAIFASNSFVVFEDKISSFFVVSAVMVIWLSGRKTLRGFCSCFVFAACIRTSTFFILCREEQTACESTYNEASYSLPLSILALAAPLILFFAYKSWKPNSHMSNSVRVWFGVLQPLLVILIAALWSISAMPQQSTLTLWIPRVIYLICLAALIWIAADNKQKPSTHTAWAFLSIFLSFFQLLLGPAAAPAIALLTLAFIALALLFHEEETTPPLFLIAALTSFLGLRFFFAVGHQAVFSTIRWSPGFLGLHDMHIVMSGFLITMSFFSGPLLGGLACVTLTATTFFDQPRARHVAHSALVFIFVQAIITLGSMATVAHLRRHLMMWKIFAPRFIFQALGSLQGSFMALFIVFLLTLNS